MRERAHHTALEQHINHRLKALGLTRGDLGRRILPKNPTKALKQIQHLYERGESRANDLVKRLAAALEEPEAVIEQKLSETEDQVQAVGEAARRRCFTPRVVWKKEHRWPQSGAAFLGASLNTYKFDPALPESAYLATALENLPRAVPAFGRVIGFTIYKSYDDATEYDLQGNPVSDHE